MRLIEVVERRVEMRCKDYDPKNKFWVKVDELMERQELLHKRMEEFNEKNVKLATGKYMQHFNYIHIVNRSQ